jgi:hypothetical protein
MSKELSVIRKLFEEKGELALLDLRYIPNLSSELVLDLMDEMGLPSPVFLMENTWLPRYDIDVSTIQHGWGNGYVKLVEGHPWYKMDYDDIPVSVHYGLTFGRMMDENSRYHPPGFWIGFDTAHHEDNLFKWPQVAVMKETIRLFEQCYLS